MKTSPGAIRRNGQEELRQNLADAIAGSGLSRAAIAREAGVPYGRLSSVIGGLGWATPDDMEKVCAVLEISVDEIKGGSLWQADRDRYVEFDYWPGDEPAAVSDSDETLRDDRKTRAICCVCGALRITQAAWTNFELDEPGDTRLMRELTCRWCDRETQHALLNLDDTRNSDEELNKAPTREQEAREELQTLIRRVSAFGVEVAYRDGKLKRESESGEKLPVGVWFHWEDARDCWRIELNRLLPARAQHFLLRRVWVDEIAAGDAEQAHRYYLWFYREVIDAVMADTDDDLARMLSVGRSALALEARDAVAAADDDSEVQR